MLCGADPGRRDPDEIGFDTGLGPRGSSVPVLGADNWRHVCDCTRDILDCELCKSHFAPPQAPEFKATVPEGCEFLESIRYSQRRKLAQKVWPWAPYSEMEDYRPKPIGGLPAPREREPLHPPWHPYKPPFNAQPPVSCSLLEGLQFKGAQEKAMIAYSMAARLHTSKGHDGTLGELPAACCLHAASHGF
jgi:hypothetical protein